MPPPRSRTHRLHHLALAGVVGPPLFVLVFTLAGWLRPGYSALRQEVSALGVGPTGWLQNINFVVFGVLLVLFAVAFADGMRGTLEARRRRTMLVLLVLSGVGMTLSGVFTMESDRVLVHWLGGFVLAFLPPIAVCFLTAVRLRHRSGWLAPATYSLAVGIAAVALIAATFVFLNPAFPTLNQLGGLLQRLLMALVFSWHVVFGWWLWRHGRKDSNTASVSSPPGTTSR